MPDNELVKYINEHLNEGFEISDIKNHLITQGYPKSDVNKATNLVRTGSSPHILKKPIKKSSKLWIILAIVGIFILGGIFLFTAFFPKTISESEFSQGKNFELEKNEEMKFVLDKEKHTIKVNSVSSDSVNLLIQSNPIQVDIKIGEEKKIDLDNDGFYDIQIRLNSIINGVPKLYIKKIHERTCVENWICNALGPCLKQGIQTTRCVDLNECKPIEIKEQNCNYTEIEFLCIENWNCSEWSLCTNDEQIRTCTDLNECGTTEIKPFIKQNCVKKYCDNLFTEDELTKTPEYESEYDLTNLNTLANSIVKGASSDYEKVVRIVEWEMKNFFHSMEPKWTWERYGGMHKGNIPIKRIFEERIVGCYQPIQIMIYLLREIGIEAEMLILNSHFVGYIPSIDRYVHGDSIADFSIINSTDDMIMTKEKMYYYAFFPEIGYAKFVHDLHDEKKFRLALEREGNNLFIRGFIPKAWTTKQMIKDIKKQLSEFNLKFEYIDYSGCNVTGDKIPIVSLKEFGEIECTSNWNCTDYYHCPSGQLGIRKCIDLNSCNIDTTEVYRCESLN